MTVATREDILAAAKVGESADWEFKSAKGGFPGGFWDTYSAMANSEGGTVVLGVREDEARGIHLDGLSAEQIAKYQKVLWDNLHNKAHISHNLLDPQQVEVVQVGAATLLVIRIPRAARTQRPVHRGQNPIGSTFRRRHESDYRCTDAEVRRMLMDAAPESRDQRILVDFGMADLDRATLTQYRNRFRATKGDHAWLDVGDQELLERLGGWRRDRTTGEQGLTLAGLLMFGRDGPIRDPEAAPEYFVDYRERLDPTTRWNDRIYPDGTWEPNLFQFYARVWPRLAGALPVPFRLEGGVRKDETPGHEALREAFVNALIHADHAAPGGVVIERFADGIVLANPGTLLVSLEQYLSGGVSECRNPALQRMFSMIGGGERAGSGIDKIRSGWHSQRWRSPRIRVQDQPERVELTMPLVSLIQPTSIEHLRTLFGPKIDAVTPAELQVLATAEAEGSVSNSALQKSLRDHPTDIGKMLLGLCERGFLLSDNRRRWTTYRLVGAEQLGAGKQASLFDSAGARRSGGRDSPQSEGDSPQSEGDSPQSEGDSPQSERDSPQSQGDLPPIDPGEWGKLRAMAEPVASRPRAAQAKVRHIILLLCHDRYLTDEDLGRLLKRNPNGLRDRFLTAMVQEGVLRLRYPLSLNRPDQAYIAADPSAIPSSTAT